MTSIHFHPNIETRIAAENLLSGRNTGAFLTWRSTETTYFVTYKSAAHRGKIAHLKVQRLTGDGGYLLPDSLDQSQFLTLEDLVASRAYLSQEADIDDDDDIDGGSGVGGKLDEESALVGGLSAPSSGLRARRGVGGAATLPGNIAPPVLRAIPLDDEGAVALDDAGIEIDESRFIRGILPILPPAVLKVWLGRTAAAGAGVAAAAGIAHFTLGPSVRASLQLASSVVLTDLYLATATLYAALRAGECDDAVHTWYQSIGAASARGQTLLDASRMTSLYISSLLFVFLVSVAASLGLFFIHTGRKSVQLNTVEAEPSRPSLLEPNQWRWARAFFSVVGGAVIAGYVLGEALGDGGAAARGVQHVAHTLSLRHTSAGRVASNLIPNYLRNFNSGPAANARPLGTSDDDLLVWYFGLWGGASVLAGASRECLARVAPMIEPLVTGAPVLRVALFGGASEKNSGTHLDPLLFFADPLAKTSLHGWLDTAPVRLALLGDAEISHALLILVAIVLFGGTAALFFVDAWFTSLLPSLKRWRARRREAARKAADKRAFAAAAAAGGAAPPVKSSARKGD